MNYFVIRYSLLIIRYSFAINDSSQTYYPGFILVPRAANH